MKTFSVIRTIRDASGYGLRNEIVGTVTAYNHLEAMQKAAKIYNNKSWLDIRVEPIKKHTHE